MKKEVLLIPVSEDARKKVLEVTGKLRSSGIPSEMSPRGRSLKGQMRRADKEGRRYVIMIGEEELASEQLLLKDMEKGKQNKMKLEKIIEVLKKG